MACYYYYYNLLNHISLSNLHTLAKKGIVPSKILNIKTTPPCASCLFGRAHRKPWRTKATSGSIRKKCQPGEECSVHQIVISSPSLMSQNTGKRTKCHYVGSQLTVDHAANYCHIAHLKDFQYQKLLTLSLNMREL